MNIAGYQVRRSTNLLEGEPGHYYNYIMAGNGLWISAENPLLEATINIGRAVIRGLPALEERVHLVHGKIPASLFREIYFFMQQSMSREVYAAVVWEDGEYAVRIPDQEASGAHVNYQRPPNTVLDMHSHPFMTGTFSGTDNRDEVGFQLYGVIGHLDHIIPEYSFRVGVYGHFRPLTLEDIFGG